MPRPILTAVEEEQAALPILLIDQEGLFASSLSFAIASSYPVVCVAPPFFVPTEKARSVSLLSLAKSASRLPRLPHQLYAAMIIVWSRVIGDVVNELINKARNDRIRIVFAFHYTQYSKKIIEEITSSYSRAYVLIYGDVFAKGKSMPGATIARYLDQATQGRIEVRNEGLEKTYPVYYDDSVQAILEACFGSGKGSRALLFLPKDPPTELSLAHMLQKVDPLLRVDFVANKKQERMVALPEGAYVLPEPYPLQRRLKHVLASFGEQASSPKPISLPKQKRHVARAGKSWFAFALLLVLTMLLLPVVCMVLSASFGAWQLQTAKQDMFRGKMKAAFEASRRARASFSFAAKASPVVRAQSKVIGAEEKVVPLTHTIETAEAISDILELVLEAGLGFERVFTGISKDAKNEFYESQQTFKAALANFQRLEAEGANAPFADNLLGKELKRLDSTIHLFSNTIDVLPKLFGVEKKQVYLVLFQNNMELRPGGGFIGSYGLLTFDKGRVSDFTIHDVYDADGQLKGHVEPPYPIRRYIPIVHWYLRDSNFSIDFPTNAETASFFLEKETGKIVDGVIAIDVTFVKLLLEAIGPVYIADYKETVSKDDLYLATQTHAEKDFFPGSRKKKNFLKSLFTAIQLHVSQKHVPYLQLAEAVGKAASEKHLLFAFKDASLKRVFTIHGLSSSMHDGREVGPMVTNDFLSINEANLGVNKANYFLKRKIEHAVALSGDGSLNGEVSVSYTNMSTSTSWPGGAYKTYLRFVLPEGTRLKDVFIDKKPQPITAAITQARVYEEKGFTPASELEIEQTVEFNKSSFGMLVEVPVQSQKTIAIAYTLSQAANMGLPTHIYNHWVFKQPGTEEDPYTFTLSYPSHVRVLSIASNEVGKDKVLQADGKLSFETKLSKDLHSQVQFSKK